MDAWHLKMTVNDHSSVGQTVRISAAFFTAFGWSCFITTWHNANKKMRKSEICKLRHPILTQEI